MKVRALTLLVLITGCQKPSEKPTASNPTAAEPSFQKPTATEIFDLRSKCADLGRKAQKDLKSVYPTTTAMSHYNPTTNRCYVELTYFNDDGLFESLIDGQTGDPLANTSNGKKGRSGYFY